MGMKNRSSPITTGMKTYGTTNVYLVSRQTSSSQDTGGQDAENQTANDLQNVFDDFEGYQDLWL
eukprot:7828989-Heterocapsa_arctica.AAC.1